MSRLSLLIAGLLTLVSHVEGILKRYDGHEVWTVVPRTPSQLEHLTHLQHHSHKYQLDFWTDSSVTGSPVMFRVPPSRRSEMLNHLALHGMRHDVTIADIQRVIDLESNPVDQDLQAKPAGFDYGKYHTLEEVNDWMEDMSVRFPQLVSIFSISTSYEGRNISALKITGREGNSTKPGFFLSAGMHAREWIAPATLIYIAGQLIEQYQNNTAVTQLIDSMEWYVLPVFNVDGYVYSWTTNRLWRKSRSRHTNDSCVGVDLNRNWDWNWCEKGASKDPCSQWYCGPRATSEPEVRDVADFLAAEPGRFRAYVDFHSYIQAWLTPWGYSREYPAKFIRQILSSGKAVNALKAVHGTRYRRGTAALTLHAFSGGAMDWAYGAAKIRYTNTVELRDTGRYGFLLPADQIIPSGEETLQGILAMARFVLRFP